MTVDALGASVAFQLMGVIARFDPVPLQWELQKLFTVDWFKLSWTVQVLSVTAEVFLTVMSAQ